MIDWEKPVRGKRGTLLSGHQIRLLGEFDFSGGGKYLAIAVRDPDGIGESLGQYALEGIDERFENVPEAAPELAPFWQWVAVTHGITRQHFDNGAISPNALKALMLTLGEALGDYAEEIRKRSLEREP